LSPGTEEEPGKSTRSSPDAGDGLLAEILNVLKQSGAMSRDELQKVLNKQRKLILDAVSRAISVGAVTIIPGTKPEKLTIPPP
jgi:hypothetical protein